MAGLFPAALIPGLSIPAAAQLRSAAAFAGTFLLSAMAYCLC